MKTMIALLTLMTSFAAHAELNQDVPCKREIVAEALAERARNSTLEFLLTNDYYVMGINKNSHGAGYYVGIETKSRNDETTVTIGYLVTVKNPKTCAVSATMMAD
jgi:hypothetical protein